MGDCVCFIHGCVPGTQAGPELGGAPWMFVEQLSPLRSWGRDFPFLPFLPSLYPEWPQPAQHGGDRRQSTGGSPREMGRGR